MRLVHFHLMKNVTLECGGVARPNRTNEQKGEGNLERVSEWKPYNWVTATLALSVSRPSASISCGIHVV